MPRTLFLTVALLVFLIPASVTGQVPGERDLLIRLGGEAGEILRQVIASPYVVIESSAAGVELPRDTVFETSVVIVRGPVYVSSTVRGDVVVVGGDLFMRPGAEISGRAVAIGGSTHHSTMARADGGLWSFRFLNVEVRDVPAGFEVREGAPPPERMPIATLPGAYGLRMPTYNRVDGVVLPWGPELALAEGRLRVTPLLAYRSQLGALDVSTHVRAEAGPRWAIELTGSRGTFTNDGWIQSDFGNSVTTLLRGRDYRNYWRAERFEGRVLPRLMVGEVSLVLGAGARTERAWSVAAGGPWSIGGRDSPEGTDRPNPEILPGRMTSLLGLAGASWEGVGMTLDGSVEIEVIVDAPEDVRFVQTTFDGSATIPTFGFQSLTFRARALFTGGDPASPQRYAYLGGSGTLPTFTIMSMGGDRLFFLESSYNIRIDAVAVGLLGSPTISLRHMLGAAGVDRLPSLEQNIGLRVALGFFRADAVLEPVDGRSWFELGLTFIR